MPDGAIYFCIARTIHQERGGPHAAHAVQAVGLGCLAEHAKELVYADGVNVANHAAAVPIGVSCRICERPDCDQRAFPPLHQPLKIHENLRRGSFYAGG